MCKVVGEKKALVSNCFVLDGCAPIVGSEAKEFSSEKALLTAWSQWVVELDPDVVTGFNINNFDWPYLLDRASHFKLRDFSQMTRVRGKEMKHKDTSFRYTSFRLSPSLSLSFLLLLLSVCPQL